jgi:ABC-2 type transport system ATP-binding protein
VTAYSQGVNTVPALQLQNLSKRFGTKPAVQGLSLRVAAGELFAFLGANGAGKTTTLRMIAGLLQPDAGDAFILGESISKSPRAAKAVLAYLPDDPLLYGKLRPMEHLEFVAGLWNVPAAEAEKRAQHWLEWLGLWGNRGELIEGFSRGMKQKMALAAALIHEPKLMILDEPLTGLDASAARQVKDLLQDYTRRGNTVILTTHILEVAERLSDRIGIISAGHLKALGTLEELRAQSGEAGSLEDVFLELTRDENAAAAL